MTKAGNKEEIQTLLDPFTTMPSFLKYSETAKTTDANIDTKMILQHADLARALLNHKKMNRSTIEAYLNTHQI
jgi:hypothetical protein